MQKLLCNLDAQQLTVGFPDSSIRAAELNRYVASPNRLLVMGERIPLGLVTEDPGAFGIDG